jgi:pyridinium-3,5-biscarboxylic acid mononucleotide sulfurtransferase
MPSVQDLQALLKTFPSVLVGYSGGVDSALLAVVARRELGRDRVLGAIGRSASYPEAQWATAREVADRFDVPVLEIETRELDDPRYLANPTNRCFFCKTELWSRLLPVAKERGLAVVCDGTNADDLTEHRPGYAAGRAAGVRSPLAEVGMTKAHVREAARDLGLPVWDAPAAPCLSSRVMYGLEITPERLKQVERAEAHLKSLGFAGDLRVRHRGGSARVEVESARVAEARARWAEIEPPLLALGFRAVELAPEGYRRGGLLHEAARACDSSSR